MIFDNKLFCYKVKALRMLKGYNKYEMSIQANIQYQYYCAIENGNKIPNFKAVISIANALDTSISYLTNVTDSEKDVDILKNKVSLKIKTINDIDLIKSIHDFTVLLKTHTRD